MFPVGPLNLSAFDNFVQALAASVRNRLLSDAKSCAIVSSSGSNKNMKSVRSIIPCFTFDLYTFFPVPHIVYSSQVSERSSKKKMFEREDEREEGREGGRKTEREEKTELYFGSEL